MYNNQLAEKIEQEFGMTELLQFSKIEAFKYEKLAEHYLNENELELYQEALYEKEWWATKYDNIKKSIKQVL
jgi:hypothetical protein